MISLRVAFNEVSMAGIVTVTIVESSMIMKKQAQSAASASHGFRSERGTGAPSRCGISSLKGVIAGAVPVLAVFRNCAEVAIFGEGGRRTVTAPPTQPHHPHRAPNHPDKTTPGLAEGDRRPCPS